MNRSWTTRWRSLSLALLLLPCLPAKAQQSSDLPPVCETLVDEGARARCQERKTHAAEQCADRAADNVRMGCYDKAVARPPRAAASAPVPPDTSTGWRIRDEVGVSLVGAKAVGKNPAKFSLADDKKSDAASVKIAALYIEPRLVGGWQLFGGLGWAKDSNAKPPSDKRTASVGMGQLFELAPGRIVSAVSVVAARSHELYLDRDTEQLSLNGDWLIDAFEASGDKVTVWRSLMPVAGLHASRIRSARSATPVGTNTGMYAGARFSASIRPMFPRWSLEGRGQWFRTFDPMPGAARQTVRYGSMSLVYNLADPEAKTGWVPSVSLTGERGTDPVTGKSATRKIAIELGVRLD